jgi:hypothetical protein
MSTPYRRQAWSRLGKRVSRKEAGRWVMSRSTWSSPVAFIWASMAWATMSRGASSFRGWTDSMNRVPSILRRIPPSPRRASDRRKDLALGWYRQVGWNWKNSMFAIRAPRRQAIATPSPVAVSGFEVYRYTFPAPPVASTTARAAIAWTSPVASSRT